MIRRKYKKPIYLYHITGFHAQKVVAVLVHVINDREKFKSGKNFYLITHDSKVEELFRLNAKPQTHQPGKPRGRETFFRGKWDNLRKAQCGFEGTLSGYYLL